MRVRLEASDKEVKSDLHRVMHLQALARKEKDVIKLTCVNDKLVLIKAQINLYESSKLQLEAAINIADDSPRTIFGEIEKTASDVKRLRGDADGCAGELEMYKQESKADVERPQLDDPTDGDPFQTPEQLGEPEIDVPGFATPYR